MKRNHLTLGLFCLVAFGACMALPARGAAPRDTIQQDGRYVSAVAGEAIPQGHLVLIRTDGLMWLAVDSATNAVNATVGRAENSAAIGATAYAKQGTYLWRNEGALTATAVGKSAYAMSSTGVTTAAIATNDVVVGTVVGVVTEGVWVKTEL